MIQWLFLPHQNGLQTVEYRESPVDYDAMSAKTNGNILCIQLWYICVKFITVKTCDIYVKCQGVAYTPVNQKCPFSFFFLFGIIAIIYTHYSLIFMHQVLRDATLRNSFDIELAQITFWKTSSRISNAKWKDSYDLPIHIRCNRCIVCLCPECLHTYKQIHILLTDMLPYREMMIG